MVWQNGIDNPEVVTVMDYLDIRPRHREFTFYWNKDQMLTFGDGEYAIRAMATDKRATAALIRPVSASILMVRSPRF
jgi:hypothetical protein